MEPVLSPPGDNSLVNSHGAETFTLFSKLIPEIQTMIWNFALPTDVNENGLRLIALDTKDDADHEPADRKLVVHKNGNGKLATSKVILDIAMSACCKEARRLYIRAFSHVFPLYRGIISYNNETTFYFRDFTWLDKFSNNALPSWSHKIKRIMLPGMVTASFNEATSAWLLRFIFQCKILETLIPIIEINGDGKVYCRSSENLRKLRDESEADISHPYAIPRIQLLERHVYSGLEFAIRFVVTEEEQWVKVNGGQWVPRKFAQIYQ